MLKWVGATVVVMAFVVSRFALALGEKTEMSKRADETLYGTDYHASWSDVRSNFKE
jgi:hypothetical protein